jgi:hypothetical protein
MPDMPTSRATFPLPVRATLNPAPKVLYDLPMTSATSCCEFANSFFPADQALKPKPQQLISDKPAPFSCVKRISMEDIVPHWVVYSRYGWKIVQSGCQLSNVGLACSSGEQGPRRGFLEGVAQ